jgi:hypothetical protein
LLFCFRSLYIPVPSRSHLVLDPCHAMLIYDLFASSKSMPLFVLRFFFVVVAGSIVYLLCYEKGLMHLRR